MAHQVEDLPPTNGNYKFVLSKLICDSSYLADQVADLAPCKWQFEIPTYRLLLWECTCGRPGGRSTPLKMAISQNFDSYSNISYWADQVWQIYPTPSSMVISDSCSDSSYIMYTLRAHIWQTRWCFILQAKAVYLYIMGRFVYFNRFGYDSWSLYGR